ncbi:LuxR C-terminal-related transcriptional regulator [Lentzea sp. NBRC 105346]|uniref:ATP-binding protein n=1 Tax=Lentzea sp. NBRC 105346 TaxID=3032205 RepID=UPI0025540505|nr:LuxR C-terminal-related transcriptional regulator [Lentzea sp. NBRC 105346]
MDSFVGRDDELAELGKLLRRVRLLTLVGPAGAGKTRLALELVARQPEVRLVDVAKYGPAEIADEVGEGKCLLLLDNCEHDIDACARLAETLLGRCPGLRILATSREALLVPGETVFGVPPLRPDAAATLFSDRAQGDVGRSEVVDRICTRLDRLPLAIELAARLVPALPPAEILARLDQRLDLLTVGGRTCASRHRSLRAAIEWSYRSLDPAEQRVFRTLSVLPGGFDLATASAICEIDAARLAVLVTSLVAKSLVVAGDGRYHQLESIRLYAHERLVEAGEREAAQDRVVAWLGEVTGPVFTPAAVGDGRCDLPIATTPSLYWWSQGHTAEGRRLLNETLARGDAPEADRCLALTHAGWLACVEGDHEEALALTEAAVLAAGDDRAQIGRALSALAGVHLSRGDFARAHATYTDCLDVLDDPLDRATCTHHLAWAVLQGGDAALADELVNRALPVYWLYAEPAKLPAILHTAGTIALHRGDVGRAEALFLDALRIAPDNAHDLPFLVEGLAIVAARDDDPERALRLIGAGSALRGPLSTGQNPGWRQLVRAADRLARGQLPDAESRAALAAGARLDRDRVIRYARDGEWPEGTENSPLTPRERQIAALVARGDTNRQIARVVRLSERTIEAHLARIREKLGLRTRTQVAAWLLSASA